MFNLTGLIAKQSTTSDSINPIPQNIPDRNNSSNFFDILTNQINKENNDIKSYENNSTTQNISDQEYSDKIDKSNKKISTEQNKNKTDSDKVEQYAKNEVNVNKEEKTTNTDKIEEKKETASADKENKLEKNKISPENKSKELSAVKSDKVHNKKNNIAEIDIQELAEKIEHLIDIIIKNPSIEQNLKKEASDLNLLMKDSKKGADLTQLNKALIKLKSILENIDIKDLPIKDKVTLSNNIISFKNILEKLTQSISKNSGKKTVALHEAAPLNTNDLSLKLDNIIDSIKGSSQETSSGNSEFSSNNGNSLDFNKNSSFSKNLNASNLTNNRNPIFKEQLQDIMNNAKMVVRDSKNARFALKLYPKELGNVNINLGLEQGVLHGKFLVENMDAKELLMQNLLNLKEELAQAGISLGEFQVNVNDQQEMLNDDDNLKNNNIIDSNVKDEITTEYEINSVYSHNGTINMVI